MSFAFKNKRLIRLIAALSVSLTCGVCLMITMLNLVWMPPDYQILDFMYRLAVKSGRGPKLSPQIVYVTITDASYDYFGKNVLDRRDVARLNHALSDLDVTAVAYDIIFARPGNPEADHQLAESMRHLGSVYLPIGLEYSATEKAFKWKADRAHERLRDHYLGKPIEKGTSRPYYATRALMQADAFSEIAFNSGHISAIRDPDGVYRHAMMLLKVDDRFFPTLMLSLFLDYVKVPFEEITVDWGNEIVIPAVKESFLEEDVRIPIDHRGVAVIPFAQTWDHGFKKMDAHVLLEYFQDENLRGNLSDFFAGNLILIGDVAVGTSDLGQTPLEGDVPLIMIHASILNGLLSNTFFRKWSFWEVQSLILCIGLVLGIAALPKSYWVLYVTGGIVLLGILGLSWIQFIRFSLVPVGTVGGSAAVILFGLVGGLHAAVSRERAFIKNAFSQYVPEKVVNQLLANPERLQLGGEERVMTVLFSDLADFTRISEDLPPSQLVPLLNHYFTEMTDIILAEGGIIDKYQGDAIMAEFGAPLADPSHADMAVRAALKMQHRLKELRQHWSRQGLPQLHCRVGINTGPMIIGNMGSVRVFDYTVIGDAVNLASRLEGANKRYNTFLMISEFTYEYITPDLFKTRILDIVKVAGKSKAVKVFEVYGACSDPVEPDREVYYQTYHEAFESYLARNFTTAAENFRKALSLRPGDPASLEMLGRIDRLDPENLPDDWDGSIALLAK